MMKTLDWYLGRSIMQTTGFALLVFVGINTLIKYIEQLKSVGRGSYDMLDAMLYTVYSMPGDIVVFFPMAALIGGLTGLGALASSSELVVMQAAGMSRLQIIGSVMKTAIVLALCMMALGEWGVPQAEKAAKQLRNNAIFGGEVFNAQKGVWAKDGNNFINIGNIEQSGELKDVNIYYFNDALELTKVMRVERGRSVPQGWIFSGIEEVIISEDRINTFYRESQIYNSQLTAEKLDVVSIDPESLSFRGIWSYLSYLEQNDQDTSSYDLALWRKVMQPLTIAVMLLVALSFIFGPLRSVSMGARIIMGVVTGLAFHLSNEIFGPIVMVYDVPAVMGAMMPSVLFIGIASYLLKRQQ
ncbi:MULTISPECIES: LPS export ABC transporter permease LptG [Pseudoalteromonas]|uniref:Lipopolysaccharide ABC transporter permease LptG n=1 Tax=Pseudoalteromonas amylolytica TaxID=1859457 RepID=A0A1S1MT70_9GAMM|nr:MULTISPECIES: LPS export ABC transporter permease LptG [Pseudoalteromonas]MCF6435358.1 LPS export ABC transporter permease LptG [Pseudoalteromonas sp. MMG022]OHU88545.1 lipopolysaccharide ABC transporter permease LptG [Pseudoalteromonas sp. JW3]OHU90388.1 lipopolysaccharide ABC transporter permease LptG [Pseudoalteromonas amylolytica]